MLENSARKHLCAESFWTQFHIEYAHFTFCVKVIQNDKAIFDYTKYEFCSLVKKSYFK